MPDNLTDVQIVPTKLNLPAVDSRWLVRPRLLSALDDALDRRLTLISAPAGYGKTTLATQWLDHIPHPSAWLSLDEQDDDLDRFLKYVIASIRKIFPRFGFQIEPLLSSPTLPPLEYLADALISDLAKPLKPWVLVFDDFQFIRSDQVQAMLNRLVQYLPNRLHLVITTRTDPKLPLAKWRGKEWLTEIRADNLRFHPEEARDYLGTTFKGQLSEDAIGRINALVEGWVTGLQMARLSLADKDDPEAFARRFVGIDRIVLEYLMDEVCSGQTDETKYFFAVTSLLERFCAPLCDHILNNETGIRESRRQIASLEKRNLFIIPLDGEGVWYRYHHLFHALLNSRLKTTLPPNRQAEIHHRAGEWFAAHGFTEDGLRHLIAAGDLDAAADLIAGKMHTAIDQDLSRRTMSRWLNMFPEGSKKRRPGLLVADAFQKMFRWDWKGAMSLLDRAEHQLKNAAGPIPAPGTQHLLGDIATLRSSIYFWRGDTKNALLHGRRGLKFVPRAHRYAHTLAIVYTAGAEALCGQNDDALYLLSKALTDDCSEGSPNAGQLLVAKTMILSYASDWDAVKESAESVLSVHKTAPQADNWLGYAHFFLGSAAYERNLLNDAMNHFDRIKQIRYLVTTRLYHDALVGLALTAWAKADTDKAREYADEAYAFAIETGDPLSMQMSNLVQARLTMFSGSGPKDAIPHAPVADSTWVWLLYPSVTHAENQIHKGGHDAYGAGLESIDDGLRWARRHNNSRLEFQYLAVKAVALRCADRRDQALEMLEKTLRRAEPHGLVRSFVDRGPMMAELLADLAKKRPEDAYLKVLSDAFEPPSAPCPTAKAASVPFRTGPPTKASFSSGLTNREQDILILLSRRLSNKEIAQRLSISPITVKTHTISIYRKLNVHNRRQAVIQAIQLGLLNNQTA